MKMDAIYVDKATFLRLLQDSIDPDESQRETEKLKALDEDLADAPIFLKAIPCSSDRPFYVGPSYIPVECLAFLKAGNEQNGLIAVDVEAWRMLFVDGRSSI